MSEFVKPRSISIHDKEYIRKLIATDLQKDLCEDEEICPWCHGTGLVITNNPYGLEGDPDKRNVHFPYKHQSITFCPHCYNGVIHRCKLCGEVLPRGLSKHDCEQQQAIDRKAAAEKERKEMDAAKEYPPEALGDFEMCYYDGYPHDNGYFMDWDSFFDWWRSECEGEIDRPKYVWGTEKTEMSMDADSIIEDAVQDLYEDAEDSISGEERKKLQSMLNEWCANCGVGTTYMESHKSKVRIPWEMYGSSEGGVVMDALISEVRGLCDSEFNAGKLNATLMRKTHELCDILEESNENLLANIKCAKTYRESTIRLQTSLEAAQKEIEQLKNNVCGLRGRCKDYKSAEIKYRNETFFAKQRAEKAEAERDTYKAALQNWHEDGHPMGISDGD